MPRRNDMDETQLIDELCALYGIASGYMDAYGVHHVASPTTRQALLRAQGVDWNAADDHMAVLDRESARGWQAMLPPVQVVRAAAGSVAISISLSASQTPARLHWTLKLETGQQQRGSFEPAHLPIIEQRAFQLGAFVRYAFTLPKIPAPGYHRFSLSTIADAVDGDASSMTLIVAPPRCYQPAAINAAQRRWGFAVQVFSLRSSRNWGIGDFSDVQAVVEHAAQSGASMVGVSPLHALFPQRPECTSPYSPSSRLFFNVLFLDIEAIDECKESDSAQALLQDAQFQAQLRALRSHELIDYAAVSQAKLAMLERLFAHFSAHHLNKHSTRAQAFRKYCTQRGVALRNQTCFDALQAHFQQGDNPVATWSSWPASHQQPDAEAVRNFASTHAERLDFFAYIYWQAELQVASIGARCLDRHLGIGLYVDLALGSDRQGADVWAHQDLFALNVDLGAPADDFSPGGQNWGLPPLLPQRLRSTGYRYFIDVLRINMRHAGALRIDHVMGLWRQFWIPAGASAEDGSYVAYPLDELLGIVALESQRNRCLVIGEDLGSVPDNLRATLADAGVLSYQVLYFNKDASGSFIEPEAYPRQALVTVSTHDLPTLAGFWNGYDLDVRSTLQLFADEKSRQDQIVQRVQDRTRLLMALESAALLPPEHSVYPGANIDLTVELATAIYLYLARTPAALLALRLEDVFAQIPQTNLPGSGAGYPNWQSKLPLNLDEWASDARLRQMMAALNSERAATPTDAVQAEHPPLRPALRIPRATYRLQFNRDFTFADATALVPYLAQLGISHCYASPFLKARPGSLHGYDIVDHLNLNPEMGTAEDFDALVDALHAHEMGLLMDVVPNHMAVMGSDNAWWLDVLENGQASAYADFFDIDWDSYQHGVGHKVLLPVLGDHYAKVLDRGELRVNLNADSGEFFLSYYDHRFPLDPREYPRILGPRLERLTTRLADDDSQALAFQSLVTAFSHLPARTESCAEKMAERARDKEIHKRQLAKLYARNADIAAFVDEQLAELNREPGDVTSADRLHELIDAQAYRLAYWRVASDEINYRRFFDINDLAALRMENTKVFATTHALVFDLLDQGKVDGLRIDHPDGLYDPLEYFTRLQNHYSGAAGADSTARDSLPVYVVVEKILAEHESLPTHWPVHGTTGYEFANLLNGLFVDADSADQMQRIYSAFSGEHGDFDDIVHRSKTLIMHGALASELNVLANQLSRIAQADRYTCDYTLNNLRRALTEVVACFPVYRSYVDASGVSTADAQQIAWAVQVAKKRSQAADISIFDFLHEVLNARIAEGKSQSYRDAVTALARKFQQYTAPVMAKGMEDTSFYIYNRLISLNEVGGNPRRYGCSVQAFHDANQMRARDWPHSLLATSTHDTKRSEDVRARIDVLSELSDEWRRCLARWHRLNRRKKALLDGKEVPSPNEEYFFYQTLLGVWPGPDADEATHATLSERLDAYLQKALREAKVHSSWINPNSDYEAAATQFVRAVLAPDNSKFRADFDAFQRTIAWFGSLNSLAQVVLKYTVPGVPDSYQGNELWDFSLVDPDNRRPVNYAQCRAALKTITAIDAPTDALPGRLAALFDTPQDDLIKLFITWKTLTWRRDYADLFRDGDYLPLQCRGAHAAHLCAFARRHQEQTLVVVVPRLCCTLMRGTLALPTGPAVWADTCIELPVPGIRWENAYTNAEVRAVPNGSDSFLHAAELFATLPFALLRAR